MRRFLLVRYLAYRVRRLIRRAEAASASDPALNEVAGQVYVGDIYSLRELQQGRDRLNR